MPRVPSRPSYHHGDLRRSLLDAADALLDERGAHGFSLREVARRAGVSPAAPAHHFGDVGGLLDAVCTQAYLDLAQALADGQRHAPIDDARGRLIGQGVGYVRFALAHPGKFRLMFERDGPPDDEALRAAGGAAFGELENGVRALFRLAADAPVDGAAGAALLALWSVVHGFAHLALAGALDRLMGSAARERWIARTLPAAIATVIDGVASPAVGTLAVPALEGKAAASSRPAPAGSRTPSSRSCSPAPASRARGRGTR